MWMRLLASGALIAGLAGCAAQPPSKVPVKDITPLQALENGNAGDQVRWERWLRFFGHGLKWKNCSILAF